MGTNFMGTNVAASVAATQADKYLDVIKEAIQIRSGMIYLRPAASYLRRVQRVVGVRASPDAKFCNAFTGILEAVGIKTVKLPARSPNLNANLERWHRSVKEECLSKMILFGEASLRQVLSNYVLHFHGERNHQGKGNMILFPRPEDRIGGCTGEIQTRERLGGLLKFYYREAA